MESHYCNVCGIEFKNLLEMEGHKDLAHKQYPLGENSDIHDLQDPVHSIPFEKIVNE